MMSSSYLARSIVSFICRPASATWPLSFPAAIVFVAVWGVLGRGAEPARVPLDRPAFRRPIALAVHGDHVAVANRDRGSLSIVVATSRRVKAEYRFARRLADLEPSPGQDAFYVLGQSPPMLWLVAWRGEGRIEVIDAAHVPADPQRIAVHHDRIAVSCRFSRQIVLLERRSRRLVERHRITLPFPPRELQFDSTGRLLAAAHAFAGELAIVDWRHPTKLVRRRMEGHNIGGLATSRDGRDLLLTHQVLQPHVRTIPERIFWGTVMGNFLRGIAWTQLQHDGKPPLPASTVRSIGRWYQIPLGEPDHGTGDPGAVAIGSDGRTAVCLSGVDEVAIRMSETDAFRRVAVGRRPVAVAFADDEQSLFVANQFDDSISIVPFDPEQPATRIVLGPTPVPGPIERGESLFYDARLSHDGWYSCHSCHVDGHTCGMLNDNLGDGSFGAPKLIPTLLGVGDTPPWSWLGRQASLVEQCRQSIASTMRGPPDAATREHAQDLAAFLRSLPPAPPRDATPESGERLEEWRTGLTLFESRGCVDCHAPSTYSSEDVYDVGRPDTVGNRRFNPPSLRGVGQRWRFFHDGRAASLEEVLEEHGTTGDAGVTSGSWRPGEKRALIEWLKTR